MEVRQLHFEDGFKPNDEFLSALAAKLRDYAAFNGCPGFKLGRVNARGVKVKLNNLLR